MRLLMLMILGLALVAPLHAQGVEKPADGKVEEKAEEKEEEKPKEPKITDEGAKLLEDVNLVYDKYYEILLAKTKANENYVSDDVWDTAVKDTKNAKYKDRKEFHAAITAMQRKDRVFRKEMQALSTAKAKTFADAIEKWAEDKK